ncbi:SecY-interacting protein [Hafnia alvei]|uniref:SecY-interacting protein n=1 Tax=Hafnia alvei TaxID=569 RepID=UPI0040449825
MVHDVSAALAEFTQRFIDNWQRESGDFPSSEALYDVASPCVVHTDNEKVYWKPQPAVASDGLSGISRALDIQLHEDIVPFFTSQYAGDMSAVLGDLALDLVQVWSEDDLQRLQENQIGHLVTQRRLKLSPTLFLATTDSELQLISLCNLTGNVLLEQFGSKQREVLAESLSEFLSRLQPVVIK